MCSVNDLLYLPLPGLDACRVQVTCLQEGEELLRRRAVVAVRPRDHRGDLQRGQCLARFSAAVVGGTIKDEDCVVSPVRVLAVELTGQPMKESAEDATVVAPLAERKVSLTAGVYASDERQSMAQGLRQLSEAFASLSPAA